MQTLIASILDTIISAKMPLSDWYPKPTKFKLKASLQSITKHTYEL
jgi:hypothetical protein